MPGHERYGFERGALTPPPPREFMHVRSGETAISSWLAQSRLLAIGLVLLLVLAACGGGDDDSDETPTTNPVTQSSPIAQRETCMAAVTTSTGSPTAGVASPSLLEPPTREEFTEELLAACPMSEAAETGGTVLLAEAGDISTVNGLLTNDTTTQLITGAMFESLIGISPLDGRPVPGLADTWDVSEDELTYTFHLNQDAKWHDGVDFTADDVAFSFDSALDPNTGFPYRSIVDDAVASYQVIDENTFEITATEKLVTFLYEGPGAITIMPQHIWGEIDPASWSFDGGSTGQDPARVIGTGPFKFEEWVQGDHVSVVRNDDYYDKVPYVDGLTLRVLPDSDSSVLALKQQEIDIMEFVPPAQMASVQSTDGLAVDVYDFFNFTYYAFNLDPEQTELFQDQRVRQALFYALDRDSITENIYFGYGEAATGTQPPISPAYAPDQMQPPYDFDPEQAKALLEEAGWTLDDGTMTKDGEKLEFDFLYSGGEPVVDQLVTYMKEAWEEIGVKINLTSLNGGALIERLESGDFDMALLAVSLSPDGNQTALFSCDAATTGLNFSQYCSEAWDQLDSEQRVEFDAVDRTQLLIDQSQLIWEDQPVGPLRFGVARTGYTTKLQNFYPNGFGLLWSLPYVWIEGGSSS
jgi:peptide/nickel transport system substrate-binding protein